MKRVSPKCLLLPASHRWKGDCGGKKQMWFPANHVEEISPSAAEPDRTVRIKPTAANEFFSNETNTPATSTGRSGLVSHCVDYPLSRDGLELPQQWQHLN